jgi:hypothetical protein
MSRSADEEQGVRSVAYALPILPGMTERGLRFLEELIENRGEAFHRQRRDLGFRRIKVFRQSYPAEMVVLYLEADDVHDSIHRRAASQHDFEEWFEHEFEELTGVHVDDAPAHSRQVELVFDWHKEHGVSRRHHPV